MPDNDWHPGCDIDHATGNHNRYSYLSRGGIGCVRRDRWLWTGVQSGHGEHRVAAVAHADAHGPRIDEYQQCDDQLECCLPVTTYTLQESANGGSTWTTVYSGTSTSAAVSGLADGMYNVPVAGV